MLFKNPVRTSKRTPHFTITKTKWLICLRNVTPDPAFPFPFVWNCPFPLLSLSLLLVRFVAILFPLFLPRRQQCSSLRFSDWGYFAGVPRAGQSPVSEQNFLVFRFGFWNCCGRGTGKSCLFWRYLGLVILFSLYYGGLIVSFWACHNGSYYGERTYFLPMLGLIAHCWAT